MGFFQSIKNKLGIGGVSVELRVPMQISKDSDAVDGVIVLTTKSEQEIVSSSVKLYEDFETGRGDEKKKKTFELGTVKLTESFVIRPGETKEIAFRLPFSILKSDNDELKEKGGALGAIGKLGAFASNEKSSYFIEAEVDVKSAALDPSAKKEVKII
ncbi:sporulation protein [Chryseobacterium sp. PS-8]|uniref:Sporulation protein n=1 Tax=Chryseobacterium indicum TaxID=2766954 RepID=A0ABS9C3A1_9FLAO|nr:sporulation protein [Chryseobacterium sp. PS-8]MCF2218232.1 sporulation protein [Chryseobacterium sp. PS-8]